MCSDDNLSNFRKNRGNALSTCDVYHQRGSKMIRMNGDHLEKAWSSQIEVLCLLLLPAFLSFLLCLFLLSFIVPRSRESGLCVSPWVNARESFNLGGSDVHICVVLDRHTIDRISCASPNPYCHTRRHILLDRSTTASVFYSSDC